MGHPALLNCRGNKPPHTRSIVAANAPIREHSAFADTTPAAAGPSREDLAVDLAHDLCPVVDDRQHRVRLLGRKHWHDAGHPHLGEDLDRVKRLAEIGIARVVPMFPPEKADRVQPIVDRWTKIMQQVNR